MRFTLITGLILFPALAFAGGGKSADGLICQGLKFDGMGPGKRTFRVEAGQAPNVSLRAGACLNGVVGTNLEQKGAEAASADLAKHFAADFTKANPKLAKARCVISNLKGIAAKRVNISGNESTNPAAWASWRQARAAAAPKGAPKSEDGCEGGQPIFLMVDMQKAEAEVTCGPEDARSEGEILRDYCQASAGCLNSSAINEAARDTLKSESALFCRGDLAVMAKGATVPASSGAWVDVPSKPKSASRSGSLSGYGVDDADTFMSIPSDAKPDDGYGFGENRSAR
ncbi:MAG: hypothetical protein EOP11_03205 [Proteobacteria bacterium]|nr:MAG: hypothetical protein EOP11_03205 [Pseudomonadota bacterium]